MANNIVLVEVTQTQAPAPSTLQQTGATISQGGTTLAAGTLQLVSNLADVTAILATPKATASITWSTNVATLTTSVAHGWTVSDQIYVTVSGAVPAAYNGTFLATVTTTTAMTYALTTNPGGSASTQGTVTPYSRGEMLRIATTYFAQTSPRPYYILELGVGEVGAGIADLGTFISYNEGTDEQVYSWLVPFWWSVNADMTNFVDDYNANDAQVYFYLTVLYNTDITGYADKKSCYVKAIPAIPTSTQFATAADWAVTLRANPNSVTRMTPLEYAPIVGVDPYPIFGNQTLFTTFVTDNVNWTGSGAEGGISNAIIKGGIFQDAKPFNYWYAADWAEINIHRALANEIINGSASTVNPLFYNQQGIDRLQQRAFGILQNAVTYLLAAGTPIATQLTADEFAQAYNAGEFNGYLPINAVPFADYVAANPSDYSIGRYAGLSCVFTPLRGFDQVVFNLNITDLISV